MISWKMPQIRQLVYALLYLQFFICHAFTFGVDSTLSKEDTSYMNNVARFNEWKCDSNDECTATNSVCNDHLCQCKVGYIYSADMTSCIKVATRFHDSCEETVQCSAYLLGGARCVDKICLCGPGYYYLHGRCNRYVGLSEKCKRDIDCYVNADFEASTCDTVEGICKCSPGFYQREYRTCRREGENIGQECTIDIDCTLNNTRCVNYKCAEKSTPVDTIELSSSDADEVWTTNDSMDEEIRVGSNCTANEDCAVLGNATCDSAGTCRCERAHFAEESGAKCIPELGEFCRSDGVSDVKKAICREGRWSCTNGTVVSNDNRQCRRATKKYNGNCQQDAQCYIFGPDAKCDNKKCVCNGRSHYVESELFCWISRGVGETCVQNRDCYVEGFQGELLCKSDVCDCPDGRHLNKNKMACIPDNSAELGDVCEVDDDCAALNSICEEEVCACAKNHYQSKNRCLAGINATCSSNEECKVKDSVCASNDSKCSCKPNYVPVAIDSCMPLSSYGEPCSLDIQCSTNIPGALCAIVEQSERDIRDVTKSLNTEVAENKVCTCSDKDHYKYGRCLTKKLLGETCANVGECYVSSQEDKVMCRNGKCMCVWDHMKWNSSACVPNPRAVFFSDNGAIDVTSTGLLSIVLFALSHNFL